jgi:hypothetical protein
MLQFVHWLSIDTRKGGKDNSRLRFTMGDIPLVQKCKGLQRLLENPLRRPWWIANFHMSFARLELRQFLDHGIYTWTHGLETQASVNAIRTFVIELIRQPSNIVASLQWSNL